MYLLIITLHKEEHLNDVLSCLIELGVEDTVIMDSESMEKALAYKVPIFAGLRFDLGGKPFSKTILATCEDKETGKELIRLLKEVDIDLESPGVARILTVKLESVLGKPKPIEEF